MLYSTNEEQTFDGLWPRMETELKDFAKRCNVPQSEVPSLIELFKQSLKSCATQFPAVKEDTYTPFIPEARAVFQHMGNVVIGKNTEVYGMNHVKTALDFVEQGGNLVLMQNHTSGADTLVLEHYINKVIGEGTTDRWRYMAGHVANWFLFPLAITAGVNRVPIVSARYISESPEEDRPAYKEQNKNALMNMAPFIVEGGAITVLYPEGGRGENGIFKPGEPRTMKIPQLISQASPNGLMILPSYVEATQILPVYRAPDELEHFIRLAQCGDAYLAFGPPQMWEDLQPNSEEKAAWAKMDCNESHRLKEYLVKKIMASIKALQPPEHVKG